MERNKTCDMMALPETFEKLVNEYSHNVKENTTLRTEKIIRTDIVLKAWDYYKQKEYENGCVKGYLNCINDHKYNPEHLSIELTESESLKLNRIAEVLNLEYPDVIKRAIDMIYTMVGDKNE